MIFALESGVFGLFRLGGGEGDGERFFEERFGERLGERTLGGGGEGDNRFGGGEGECAFSSNFRFLNFVTNPLGIFLK